MLPDFYLSTTAVPGPFLYPDDLDPEPLKDYEYGGVALRDSSQGSRVKVWTVELVGDDVTIYAADVSPAVQFNRSGITEVRLAFDQNMNPCVAFMQAGQLVLWWYDSLAMTQVFTEFDGTSPKVCQDDKRPTQGGACDIIFTYLRDGSLYYRAQRERFLTERLLGAIPPGYFFKRFGMNTVNRLQWEFEFIIPVPTP